MSQAGYEKKVYIRPVSPSGEPWEELPVTSASLSHGGDLLDDTNTKESGGNRTRIYGLRDWSISITFLYDNTDSGVTLLRNAWLNRTDLEVRYLPDGTVGNGFQGDVAVETFNMSGDVGALETVESTLQAASVIGAAT